jgi:protein-histidine pros-kinase
MSSPPPDYTPDQLLAVIATLQEAQEAGRARLARVLHQELGGLLAAAQMELSRQRALLPGGDAAPLAEVERQLMLALQIKRTVVEAMRPGLLEHFGLAAALGSHFEQRCNAVGLALSCRLPQVAPPVVPQGSLALYRLAVTVLEGALAAGARAVELTLDAQGTELCLQITQDVAAAPFAATPAMLAHSLWLARLGGRCEQRVIAGGGTLCLAHVPTGLR